MKWILLNKKLLIRLFWVVVLVALVGLMLMASMPMFRSYWYRVGTKLGSLSAIIFMLVVTPGIFKRFGVSGWLVQVQVILMSFRRQLGILMYLLAIGHSLLVINLQKLLTGVTLLPSDVHQLLGTLAVTLALPLFLTSNDFSQKKLGVWWYRLHKLVYVITWLIFGHVALVPSHADNILTNPVGLMMLTVASMEVWSFVVAARKKKLLDHRL